MTTAVHSIRVLSPTGIAENGWVLLLFVCFSQMKGKGPGSPAGFIKLRRHTLRFFSGARESLEELLKSLSQRRAAAEIHLADPRAPLLGLP